MTTKSKPKKKLDPRSTHSLAHLSQQALVKRASNAYFRRFGAAADQPGAGSHVDGDRVILCNVNSVLATYRIKGSGLRWVDSSIYADSESDLSVAADAARWAHTTLFSSRRGTYYDERTEHVVAYDNNPLSADPRRREVEFALLASLLEFDGLSARARDPTRSRARMRDTR